MTLASRDGSCSPELSRVTAPAPLVSPGPGSRFWPVPELPEPPEPGVPSPADPGAFPRSCFSPAVTFGRVVTWGMLSQNVKCWIRSAVGAAPLSSPWDGSRGASRAPRSPPEPLGWSSRSPPGWSSWSPPEPPGAPRAPRAPGMELPEPPGAPQPCSCLCWVVSGVTKTSHTQLGWARGTSRM